MPDKIEREQAAIGKGPYEVDSITSNAVIILKSPLDGLVGVYNMDALDATDAYVKLGQFVDKFKDVAGVPVENDDLEAILVGGEFRENFAVGEGILVHKDYRAARIHVERALELQGISVRYRGSDRKAVKNLVVGTEGSVSISQERRGFNKRRSTMSWETYINTIGKGEF